MTSVFRPPPYLVDVEMIGVAALNRLNWDALPSKSARQEVSANGERERGLQMELVLNLKPEEELQIRK